jgi:LmbE family N-acetylglucosaminyl deacetylase
MKVLVVAAHPDDEVLGLGGTLLKHQSQNDEIFIIILSEGRNNKIDKTNNKKLSKFLGVKKYYNIGLKDQRFDTYPLTSIIVKIEKIKEFVNPDIVYTHYSEDLNLDHKICSLATLTAFRPFDQKRIKIFQFETPSSTEISDNNYQPFNPDFYVDIDNFYKKKIELLNKFYFKEMRKYPHPRSIEYMKSLAILTGAKAGLKLAEGFKTIRNYY